MSTISFILVVLVALVVGMASVLDERQFYRPLVACTLMGLVMGDLTTVSSLAAHSNSSHSAG